MNEERAIMIREQRAMLLSNLSACFPGSLAGEQLYRVMLGLFPAYPKQSCIRDLFYLEQKGYCVRKHPRTGKASPGCEWKEAMWAVTPLGNEVAEHLVNDPAMEV